MAVHLICQDVIKSSSFWIFILIYANLMCQSALGQKGKKGPPSYSTTLETTLRTELFQNYSLYQRPSKLVQVKVSMTLLTVNDLNIKDQTLSISAILSLGWFDSRLSWRNNPALSQDYSNIGFMFSSELFVWKPAIFIENSVEDISVISDPQIPMRIINVGWIKWSPAGIYKVACESDITYYPLDYQSCTIKFTTSSYTQSEINLRFEDEPVNLIDYSKNGEWELISAIGEKVNDAKARGGQSFSSIEFTINMRRRPLFHVLNTMFPVALMALLIPMVFKLHPDSGEKIGYSLTVLLAYAVYLTLISDNIPSTSVSVCFISIYLAMTLAVATVSVLFVIIVINVYHTPDERPIPRYIQKISLLVLAKLACWNGHNCCSCCKRPISCKKSKVKTTQVKEFEKKPIGVKVVEVCDEEEDEEMTWKMLASLLDDFFFLMFMFLVLVSTVAFIAIIALEYASY